MADDLDITELERRLFPTPVSTWTAKDFVAYGVRVKALYDEYGKDRISAMTNELMAVNAGGIRAYWDALKRAKNGE